MDSLNGKCLEFIGSKVQELIQHGISVYISNKPAINNKYGGYFSAHDKVFRVAMGNGAISVYKFLHEYAHFLQYRDRPDFWKDNFCNGVAFYFRWLQSGKCKNVDLKDIFNKTLVLEHDAEKTALSIISSHNLDLDLDICTREANSNLLFYVWTRLHKTWRQGHFPREDSAMNKKLPSDLLTLLELTDKKFVKRVFKIAGITKP